MNFFYQEDGSNSYAEIKADIDRRYAELYMKILSRASIHKRNINDEVDPAFIESENNSETDFQTKIREDAEFETVFNKIKVTAEEESANKAGNINGSSADAFQETEYFKKISVSPIPYLSSVKEVETFDSARAVFIKAVSRVQAALKYYVIDGFVTDHIMLLELHSSLYGLLIPFETDIKRKLAMHQRRVDMLSPLLKVLNMSAYDLQHKQISYQIGEVALAMIDLKLDKLRLKQPSQMKKSEISNLNQYCKVTLAMFAHFTQMYSQTSSNISSQSTYTKCEELVLHQV